MNRKAEAAVDSRMWKSSTKSAILGRKSGGVVTSEKKELWKRCIEKTSALPQDYCRGADGKTFSIVLGPSERRNVETAFCSVDMQAEIQTAGLIEEVLRAGRQVAVLYCAGKGVIYAHVIRSPMELRPGVMGTPEPPAEVPVLSSGELDLILLPCVSTSRPNERLGYGGGPYDHYLSKIKAFRAFLIRERLLSDDIPREAHDQSMDIVITEAGISRRTRSEDEGVS